MRRSTIFITGCLMLAPCATAFAQEDGYGYRYQPDGDSGLPYFAGLRGSLAFNGHAGTTIPGAPASGSTPATTPTALRASFNTGGGGSLYIGARLPYGFRAELEALARYQPIDQVSLGNLAPIGVHGSANIAAPMVNLLWDVPVPDFPFRPFVGAGIGGAYVAGKIADPNNANTYAKSDSWNFAYQLMAGAEVPLSQSSRFTAMYRWLQIDGSQNLCGTAGAPTLTCKANINTQSVDFGIEMDM